MSIYEEFEKKYKEIPYVREKREEYRINCNELNMEFKAALEKEYGIVNHPKADKLWEIAWDEGHSSGYSDVEIYYERFLELIL